VSDATEPSPSIEEKAPWIAQVPKELRGEDLLSLGSNLGEVVKNARDIIKERDALKTKAGPKPGVPETPDGYKFAFPDDFPKDLIPSEAELKQFAAVAKKLNLSADEAAELLNFEAGRAASTRKAFQELTAQNTKRLRDELQDTYKEKADEKLAGAYKVIDQFGDAELRKELDATGMGNNPRLVKMLIKIGSHFTEKGITAAPGTGTPPAEEGVDLKQVYARSYATGAMK
jgi:hypothetical protein